MSGHALRLVDQVQSGGAGIERTFVRTVEFAQQLRAGVCGANCGPPEWSTKEKRSSKKRVGKAG